MSTDDDFCPKCREDGATVVLGPARGDYPAGSRASSSSDDARSTVMLLFFLGILVQVIGGFVIGVSSGDGEEFGIYLMAAGGIPVAIALTAIAVSLGIRMSRDS